jgi:hypothetical protein
VLAVVRALVREVARAQEQAQALVPEQVELARVRPVERVRLAVVARARAPRELVLVREQLVAQRAVLVPREQQGVAQGRRAEAAGLEGRPAVTACPQGRRVEPRLCRPARCSIKPGLISRTATMRRR